MSEANRVKIRASRETTWGETVAGPATTEIRVTSEGLIHEKATVVSAEIRSDRQRTNLLEVGNQASGPLNFELIYGEYESFFEQALRSAALLVTSINDASTTFAASSITMPTGVDFTPFQTGQWVIAKGVLNANALVQVESRTSTVLTITGTTLQAEVVSTTVLGRTIKNGTTKSSYFLEVDYEDITAVKYFSGMRVDRMQLQVTSQQIVTGAFNFMGKQGFQASTSVASTTTSAGSNVPMTAAANVVAINEAGVKLTNAVQAINLDLGNNMRALPQVSSKFSNNFGDGGVDVTGTLNAYFEDVSLYKKFLDHTASNITIQFKDVDGNFIVISLPEVQFSRGAPTTPGQDQDIFVPLDFTAFRDATDDLTIRMEFLPSF